MSFLVSLLQSPLTAPIANGASTGLLYGVVATLGQTPRAGMPPFRWSSLPLGILFLSLFVVNPISRNSRATHSSEDQPGGLAALLSGVQILLTFIPTFFLREKWAIPIGALVTFGGEFLMQWVQKAEGDSAGSMAAKAGLASVSSVASGLLAYGLGAALRRRSPISPVSPAAVAKASDLPAGELRDLLGWRSGVQGWDQPVLNRMEGGRFLFSQVRFGTISEAAFCTRDLIVEVMRLMQRGGLPRIKYWKVFGAALPGGREELMTLNRPSRWAVASLLKRRLLKIRPEDAFDRIPHRLYLCCTRPRHVPGSLDEIEVGWMQQGGGAIAYLNVGPMDQVAPLMSHSQVLQIFRRIGLT